MDLKGVHQGIHKHKRRKRLGRGPGSKTGRTAGRGNKGQYARSGDNPGLLHEGGTMPLFMRIPKRGFNNPWRTEFDVINVNDLEKFDAGSVITPKVIDKSGIYKLRHGILKILGEGELTKKFEVHAHKFTATAKEKIEQAGGSCIVIAPLHRGPKIKNKMRPKRSPEEIAR
ncbi:50S ribosomal protein L15 [bacterium]|nr:50S ribosomal protein L15 [bacterium]